MVNPLNFYGPYFPSTFESKTESGDIDVDMINELIDNKIVNAAFIGE